MRTLVANGTLPSEAGAAERLLAQSARARLALGDEPARHVLASLLLSEDERARQLAFDALTRRCGEDRGCDPAADEALPRAAVARWME